MSIKKVVVGCAVLLIGLPLLLASIAAIAYGLADRTNGTLVSSGERRDYLVYVPPSYDAAKPAPLVVSLHASALWPASHMALSRWNTLADEHGFIVVYPSAAGFPKMWRLEAGADAAKEVRFVHDVIAALAADFNIDPKRIYANGLSTGAGLAMLLSCDRARRVAAVGAVAAAHLPWDRCEDAEPVPLIAFHGTADELVPYAGGLSWAADTPWASVPDWIEGWARRNRCTAQSRPAALATDVTRLSYGDCAGGAGVVLHTIDGGGHSWPGGPPAPAWMAGRTSDSIDATAEMWAFFREHELRAWDE